MQPIRAKNGCVTRRATFSAGRLVLPSARESVPSCTFPYHTIPQRTPKMLAQLCLPFLLLTTLPSVLSHSHSHSESEPHHAAQEEDENELWMNKYGPTVDMSFSGITTFAHLPHVSCLDDKTKAFDIAVLGAPFDVRSSLIFFLRCFRELIRTGF